MKFITFILLFSCSGIAQAQSIYRQGEHIKNFEVGNIINYKTSTTNFSELTAKVTIIDFFGTWCLPCIKALPGLEALKNKYGDDLKIVLVSNETSTRLEKFVENRQPFPFPVVVDSNSSITNQFQPPSYPYTVVIDDENKIIAITDASSITEKMVSAWIEGDMNAQPAVSTVEKSLPIQTVMNINKNSSNKIIALSQQLAYAAKTGEAADDIQDSLKTLTLSNLQEGLKNDDEKKAFWINVYNGYTQLLLRKNPDAYQHRKKFFTTPQVPIAGEHFSLDDIEHGILRRSKVKWSLGYIGKLFPGRLEKSLRADTLDYRVHFALNCGAKSCPPIAFYDSEKIDQQLEMATNAYLTGEAVYDPAENKLGLPAIMGWFRKDFGGKKQMLKLVKEKGIVPPGVSPHIYFNKYDWELHLQNFQ